MLVRSLSPAARRRLAAALWPRLTPYIPHLPTPKQRAFLLLSDLEALYGGAAGGGKSEALLMAALQYVDVPGYAALLLRRTYSDLKLPGALLDRAAEWLRPTSARWIASEMTWAFPSGATLTFGHLQNETDKYRYQSAEFQFVGFDELTQFTESQYLYLFSRLRRLAGSDTPLRMRAASNPGGAGHEWVKARFIPVWNEEERRWIVPRDPETGAVRRFVPARLEDNPHLDQASYLLSLARLDPVTRRQYRYGDWSAKRTGGYFDRAHLPIREALPEGVPPIRTVRYWDLASTEAGGAGDPDWTAGVKMAAFRDGTYGILDVVRLRGSPARVQEVMAATAALDGRAVPVLVEQEPGAAGAFVIQMIRKLLVGYTVRGVRSTGDKVTRAGPLSTQADAGRVWLLRGEWNAAFIEEAEAFPSEGVHDDQVDAASGAFAAVVSGGRTVGF